MLGLRFEVWSLEFGVWGLRFGVWGWRIRDGWLGVEGGEFRFGGQGFRVGDGCRLMSTPAGTGYAFGYGYSVVRYGVTYRSALRNAASYPYPLFSGLRISTTVVGPDRDRLLNVLRNVLV